MPAPPAADSGASSATLEGESLWQSLLDDFRQDEKYRIYHKFLSQGRFAGMTDTLFRVRFTSKFIKARVEGDDYRRTIEERLAKLSGVPLRLACEEAASAPPPPPPPRRSKPAAKAEPAAPATPSTIALSPEGKREEAILTGFFGGHFEPIPPTPAAPAAKKAAAEKPAPEPAAEKASPQDEIPLLEDIPFPDDDDAPPPEDME